MSEQLAQQLQRFVQPFLEILDAYVDCRLVEPFWRTMVAIIVARTNEARVGVGGIPGRSAAWAGRDQTTRDRLLHSAKWCSGLIERNLGQQAEQRLIELEAAGEQPLCVWDASRARKTRE